MRSKPKYLIFLALFLIISWSLFTYKITEVPGGINGDEAAIAYNAALVSKTGRDQNNRLLPVFVSTLDLKDWKQPVTFYTTVTAFKIFGPSYFMLRAVSVFFALISAVVIFFLIKEILDLKSAFISLAIFSTIPLIMIQAHLALENIAPVPFISFWLLMLAKFQKNPAKKYIIGAALSLGISLFSYPGLRLIMPVLSLVTIFYIVYLISSQKNTQIIPFVSIFISIIGLFILCMLVTKNAYPGAILAYNRPQIPSTYQDFLYPYISTFDPSFLFLKGDSTLYHSTGKQGMFLLATLPLFLLGIFNILKKKTPFLLLVLASFVFSPLLYGLAGSVYRASRLMVLVPLFTIIAVMGFRAIYEFKNDLVKTISLVIMVFLIFLNYYDFLRDYWGDYTVRSRNVFDRGAYPAYDNLYKTSKQLGAQAYTEIGVYNKEELAAKFFDQVYFNGKLKQLEKYQKLPGKGVIIIHDADAGAYKKLGFEEVDFEMPYYQIMYQK